MAAHFPRRTFAAPFVVTLVTGCANDPPVREPPQNPPGPSTATPSAVPPASAAPSAAAPSAAPIASATPATGTKVDILWKISYDGTKKECVATRETNETAPCPPGEKCDGPPVPFACIPEISRYPTYIRREASKAKCTALVTPDTSCGQKQPSPVEIHCNPPPPYNIDVDCPR